MRFYHGTRFYAVDSRTISLFGGRAGRATIKIYDSSSRANVPIIEIAGDTVKTIRSDLADKSRDEIDTYLIRMLPHGWLT